MTLTSQPAPAPALDAAGLEGLMAKLRTERRWS